LILSCILSWSELQDASNTLDFYKGVKPLELHKQIKIYTGYFHPLALMDYIANFILPIIFTAAGFILIATQENYIEAVLTAIAILFIIQMDNILPGVLFYDLDATAIVHNHLIREALVELKEYQEQIGQFVDEMTALVPNVYINGRLRDVNGIPRIQFADMLLTNHPEGGGTQINSHNENDSIMFTPHEVLGKHQLPELIASNYITGNCLFKKIEWSYTTGYFSSGRPRVASLRLWKVNAGDDEIPYEVITNDNNQEHSTNNKIVYVDPHVPVDDPSSSEMTLLLNEYPPKSNNTFETTTDDDASTTTANTLLTKEMRDDISKKMEECNPIYKLEGIYIITTVECSCSSSEGILKLRVCGSKTANDFQRAMKEYSLWELDASAKHVLKHNK